MSTTGNAYNGLLNLPFTQGINNEIATYYTGSPTGLGSNPFSGASVTVGGSSQAYPTPNLQEVHFWGMALVAALVIAIGVEEVPKLGVPFMVLIVLVLLYVWKG